ncbi:MAG: hypothetical protein ACK56I_28325, partial [bacterium]
MSLAGVFVQGPGAHPRGERGRGQGPFCRRRRYRRMSTRASLPRAALCARASPPASGSPPVHPSCVPVR